MKFLGCIVIGIVLSFLISSTIRKFTCKKIIIENKYKYYFISFCISALVGVFVFCCVDYNANVFYAGFLWGIIDGMLQTGVTCGREKGK